MSNPLTYLNSLFDAFADKTLSGHDQLVMLHIFNQFNRSHWTRTVRISDSELLKLCRLYDSTGKPITLDTLRTVKSRLKLKGFIDFKSGKGNAPTEYRLANPPDSPAESPRDTPQEVPTHSAQFSYSRTREDVKTLDIKTELTTTASAGANVTELDNVLDYWEQSQFGRLDAELISKLEVYLKRYGLAAVKAAMDAAKGANKSPYGVSFNFFAAVLEKRQSPKSVRKGGESSAKPSVDFTYKPVEFDYGEKLW